MSGNQSPLELFELAKTRTDKAVGLVIALIELRTNCDSIRSEAIRNQIPKSYAAHSYNLLARSVLDYFLVRLCAIWDKRDKEKISLPTIGDFISDKKVSIECHQAIETRWSTDDTFSKDFYNRQIEKEKRLLDELPKKIEDIDQSEILKSARNIRDKHLAHNLEVTWAEKKGAINPLTDPEADQLYENTIAIVDDLHIVLNGSGFMWDDSRRIAQKSADQFWLNCKFNIPNHASYKLVSSQ